MNNQNYREIFEQMDIPMAIFNVITEYPYRIKDILIEDYNHRYLNNILRKTNIKKVRHQSILNQEPDVSLDQHWRYYFYCAAIKRQHVHGILQDAANQRWLEISGGPGSEPHTCWMTFIDRTKSRKLLKLSMLDELTNTNNRHAYQLSIEQLKHRHLPIGVIFADLNDLKNANDQHGHQAGDQYLKKAAGFLCSLAGDNLPYRIGGDEFVMLLAHRSQKETIEILQQIQSCKYSSFSSGAAWTIDSSKIEMTIAQADHNMYQAKRKYYQSHHRRHIG